MLLDPPTACRDQTGQLPGMLLQHLLGLVSAIGLASNSQMLHWVHMVLDGLHIFKGHSPFLQR